MAALRQGGSEVTGRGKRGGVLPLPLAAALLLGHPHHRRLPIAEQWKAGYKKQEIAGYCDSIKDAGNTSYWVCAQALAGGGTGLSTLDIDPLPDRA